MTATGPQVYLLDVEGTVAPLSLVTDQLFPYARAHFESFLRDSLSDSSVHRDLTMLKLERTQEQDPEAPSLDPPASRSDPRVVSMSPAKAVPIFLRYVFWLMDRDRKSTALKSLQGKIWKAGFERGELKGTLFDDVPGALARWAKTAKVAIYSSGSVEAQQLLFRHSNFGDLTPLISGYFDTRTGAKSDSASYVAIAADVAVDPAGVLFFSDVVRELDAARAAGCATRLVIREGNAPVTDDHGHTSLSTLTCI